MAMSRFIGRLMLALPLAAVVLSASSAQAAFHLWKIDEIFSSADGTVQFIELHDNSNNEQFLDGVTFQTSADSHVYTFDHNLAGHPTADTNFLMGTAAYAAAPGAVPPDFVIPPNFFSVSGDTLTFVGSGDFVTFAAGTLPTNGNLSLFRNLSTNQLTTGPNSPTNFAGATGSLNLVTNPHPWRNPTTAEDVDNNTRIEPADALTVIDELNIVGSHALVNPPVAPNVPPPYFDTNGDDSVSPNDALQVIDRLNTGSASLAMAMPLSVVAQNVSVPEPSTGVLSVCGLLVLAAQIWRRNKKVSTL